MKRGISLLFLSLLSFNSLANECIIYFNSSFNYRQTYNDCGPYSATAVYNVLKDSKRKPEYFVKQIKFRLKNKYTLPWGIEDILKKNEIKIKIPQLMYLKNNKKIEYIKSELLKGNPIILLGGTKNYQHYITLLGFKDDIFYIYDSLLQEDADNKGLTIDLNADKPGNRNLSENQLLEFWKYGGKGIFFRWYALVASK